jgi:endonuclease/exonuclease/phosphatase family metal-dependent hydrolase
MGCFRHKHTGTGVLLMSTHLDHQGEEARKQSAALILRLARSWADESCGGEQPYPLFLGGDFNSTPEGEAYRTITAPGTGMRDISGLVPKDNRYGNDEITYTSFGEPDETPGRIDFLFVQDTGGIEFRSFAILPNRFDDAVFLSDHRAVVADVEMQVSGFYVPR